MARPDRTKAGSLIVAIATLLFACRTESRPAPAGDGSPPPSILLVTLDTTRADSIGPEAEGIETPAFDALARRGLRFRQAYATAPETLPAHASLLTGLYPAGHGVHENARPLSRDHALVAERLQAAGYRTAAFVSSFVLARRFGLARGFQLYDDELPAGGVERSAAATTDRAVAYLAEASRQPLLLFVHYYDPHHPYAPPEPFRARYAARPYLGEIAAVDAQLGRLVEAFERSAPGAVAIVVVGDHGEGLGEHGEAQHGRLLYQATMRVPLLVVAPGAAPDVVDTPVSTRRVFHTLLDAAGVASPSSLTRPGDEIVLGEAMKPFLSYGWQPQVMAVEGSLKVIQAGRRELYDLGTDPEEARDLAASVTPSRALRTALLDYPVPTPGAPPASEALGEEERRKLASLGYVGGGTAPVVREDAPRPVEMAPLFDVLDQASTLFVRERYREVIPLLRTILARDPRNLDAALRLATAHSSLGEDAQAERAFERAAEIAPGSEDVRSYRALHYARGPEWRRAVPLLEAVTAEAPDRLPPLEALARLREKQGRLEDALALWTRVHELRPPGAAELVHLGELAMSLGRTELAISRFEQARAAQGASFARDLELGVLYLAARRLPEARAALDRVPPSHPGYPMALFKRAQVSVLLGEPDRARRIDAARRGADTTTRELIAKERLFAGAGGS